MAKKNIENVRHSLAHLLAAAVLKKFPSAKLGIGPTIEDGFYYDFLLPRPVSANDFPELENTIKDLIKERLNFSGKTATLTEIKKLFKNQPFKQELAQEFSKQKQKLTVYKTGNIFIDLCRGGHVKNTKEIDPEAFKLTRVAGAYWRGDASKTQMQRIYGVAFSNKKELVDYFRRLEEAQKRDHRVLGEKMKIFMFSDQVGPGLPLLLPNGEFIKHKLIEYMREKEEAAGYKYVSTPAVTQAALYERSGHKQYFGDNMYHFTDPEGVETYIKPMNCPHAHMIYEKIAQSYRDLPLRLAEAGAVYRFELSGTLSGLIRVRGPITQNDAHIYVIPEQLEKEFLGVIKLFKEIYKELNISDYWFRLSLPDFKKQPKKYGGNKKLWQWASKAIESVLKKNKVKHEVGVGEASFYGPKLDVQTRNVLGKEETIATIQVDILVPQKMGLFYIDKKGKKQTPIVIHRAIIGSYERFIAFILEKTAGHLPLWLSPAQASVINVGSSHKKYAVEVFNALKKEGVRVALNDDNLTVGKRIREAEIARSSYIIVVGNEETKNKTINVRHSSKGVLGEFSLPDFIKQFKKENNP